MRIYWWCLTCDQHGKTDSQAAKHTKDTHHATMTSIRPRPDVEDDDIRFHGE